MVRLKSLVAFIPTRDADRAREFYTNVVGLRFVQDDGFALVMDFDGTMVRIAKVGDYQPFPFTLLGWEVDDIGAAVKALTAKGAAIERYSFLEQDEAGVWDAPGGAKVAWFKDPDGNLLSVSQHPPSPSGLRRTSPPSRVAVRRTSSTPARNAAASKSKAAAAKPPSPGAARRKRR